MIFRDIIKSVIIILFLSSGCVFLAKIPEETTPTQENIKLPSCISPLSQVEKAFVNRAIDGDSIEVTMDGKKIQVRYIGINAPDYGLGVDAQARAAERANRELVEGKIVYLYRDISDKDKYQRLLRYVFVNDIFVNQWLVQQGFAQPRYYSPDTTCQNALFFSR